MSKFNFIHSAMGYALMLSAVVRDFFNPKGGVAVRRNNSQTYGRSRSPGVQNPAGTKLARMAEAHAIGKRGRVANY